MLHDSSRTLKGIRELNRPSSRKNLLGTILALIVVPRKVCRMFNGTLNGVDLWGSI